MADNAMYDSRGFRLNLPTYSTEGNLTDRGFPDSKSGIGAAGATGSKVDVSSRNTTTTPKATGSGSGAGSAYSGYVGGDVDVAGALAAMLEQQKADAQAAYDRAMSSLDSAYNSAYAQYNDMLNRGVEQLGRSYNNSRGKINSEAEDAFRQAYVNRMISERNLSQRLAAMGMSGGASESTMADLLNTYANSRNGIQRTRDNNLSDLEMNYMGNLTDLRNNIGSALSALYSQRAAQESNLAMQLAQLNTNMGGNYYSALMSNIGNLQKLANRAVSAQAAYSAPAQAQATNNIDAVNIQQANDRGGTATNWSAWQNELLKQLNSGNSNVNGAIASLKGQASPEEVAAFLNSLRTA